MSESYEIEPWMPGISPGAPVPAPKYVLKPWEYVPDVQTGSKLRDVSNAGWKQATDFPRFNKHVSKGADTIKVYRGISPEVNPKTGDIIPVENIGKTKIHPGEYVTTDYNWAKKYADTPRTRDGWKAFSKGPPVEGKVIEQMVNPQDLYHNQGSKPAKIYPSKGLAKGAYPGASKDFPPYPFEGPEYERWLRKKVTPFDDLRYAPPGTRLEQQIGDTEFEKMHNDIDKKFNLDTSEGRLAAHSAKSEIRRNDPRLVPGNADYDDKTKGQRVVESLRQAEYPEGPTKPFSKVKPGMVTGRMPMVRGIGGGLIDMFMEGPEMQKAKSDPYYGMGEEERRNLEHALQYGL